MTSSRRTRALWALGRGVALGCGSTVTSPLLSAASLPSASSLPQPTSAISATKPKIRAHRDAGCRLEIHIEHSNGGRVVDADYCVMVKTLA